MPLQNVKSVAGGYQHSAVLMNDGTVWTWGADGSGQLGNGSPNTDSSLPVQVPGLTNVSRIAVGSNHCVVVRGNRTVWTWGLGTSGQLGNGGQTNTTIPVQVTLATGLTNGVVVAAGGSHTLALATSGIWAWGNNANGQLGAGNTTSTNRPILVSGAVAAQSVAAGGSHSLALLANGTVLAWGLNASGQLGTGNNTSTNRPVTVSGLSGVVQVACGGAHSLALKADGTVWAWGLNSSGQLGNNSTTSSNAPVQVSGLNNVVEIAAGNLHSLAKKADGTVWAWGDNSGGQMGVGIGTPYSMIPKQTSIVLGGVPSPLGGGFMHSTVIKYSGAMWACGDNILGELYLGTSIPDTNRPAKAANAGYVAVVAGLHNYSTLGLKADGEVWAWGDNTYGQLGTGNTTSTNLPIQVTSLSNIVAVAMGGDMGAVYTATGHSMALGADGTVWGWGRNNFGQIGDGTTTDRTTPVRVVVPGGAYFSNVVAVAAGAQFSLALRSDATVWAWGDNSDGIFGSGTSGTTNFPRYVNTLTNVVAISAGEGFACALLSDGTIRTWGENRFGCLGNGSSGGWFGTATPAPQNPGLNNIMQIQCGCYDMYALAADGTIWSWGDNTNGQIGNNNTTDQSSPYHITTLSNVVAMGTGHFNARAVTSDGSVYLWGLTDVSQLGSATENHVPTKATWLSNVQATTGGRQHSLWLTRFGTMWASGRNTEGQAGNGSSTNVAPQVEVKELYALDAVAIGAYHSLALKSDGAVWAVGANWAGQLGTGSAIPTNVPVATKITTLSNVVTIATGQDNSMALTTNGYVYTWGYNGQGELGNGTTTNTNQPIRVASLSNVVAIASGFYHNLALLTNGTVRAWGYNGYGNLGNGGTNNQATPVTVAGLSNVVTIAAGGYHNLALKSDGTVWAWGYNGYGQLGDGTYDPDPLSFTLVPHSNATQVVGPGGVGFLTNIVDIVAGAYHSLALSGDGFVYAWGGSWLGQVGNGGTNYQQVVPVKLLSLTNVVAIGRGDFHSMAMGTDGSVWTWGANWLGQLGDGTTIQRNTPVQSLLPLP
jgi:alpha-tubulin suppressor-like RCC1 family protein